VHDGVIFVHSYNDHVQALDAATGDELWRYSRRLPSGTFGTVQRNIALYGDKLYLATSDGHVVALEMKTGRPVWEHQIGDGKTSRVSGGPVVAKGLVMQGTLGRAPGGQYIVGLDAQTGRLLWRFNSIAQPGEPHGDSWNGVPIEKRTGGSVWTAGSYDADQNLVFFGPAPTYDTGPLRDLVKQRGVSNDALYTNSTVALDPHTGQLKWHYQHRPNDQWDLDWAFERQIITLPVDGRGRKLIITAGKEAIYDALDAHTGRYVFSIDLGLQNFVTAIDPKSGAKTIDPNLIPNRSRQITVCPHAGGAKNWLPGSYDPSTRIMYVPLVESCMDMIPVPEGERGALTSGVRWTVRPRPESDGRYGRLQAIDLETRKTVWIQRQRAPQSSGVLATAGGLVFAGALDRWFTAYDAGNGEPLWQVRLSDVPNSAPITYSVNGKQYIAVVVGYGGPQVATFPVLVPEIRMPAAPSSAIWVFELGE
jgi:alcohol dehydrogenase (cytochrome c)